MGADPGITDQIEIIADPEPLANFLDDGKPHAINVNVHCEMKIIILLIQSNLACWCYYGSERTKNIRHDLAGNKDVDLEFGVLVLRLGKNQKYTP